VAAREKKRLEEEAVEAACKAKKALDKKQKAIEKDLAVSKKMASKIAAEKKRKEQTEMAIALYEAEQAKFEEKIQSIDSLKQSLTAKKARSIPKVRSFRKRSASEAGETALDEEDNDANSNSGRPTNSVIESGSRDGVEVSVR